MGLDYGLKRQCIRTPYPDEANFYVDNVDCPGGAYPTSHYWNTVAEIEDPQTGGSCIGPSTQSVLINGPGSPITQVWHGSAATGYTIDFKVDYTNLANPCAPPTFTELPLSDNPYCCGNEPLPRPDQFLVQYTVTLNRTLSSPAAGGVHCGSEAFVTWLVAGSSTPISLSLQIDYFFDQSGLCCATPPGLPPDVIEYGTPRPGYEIYVIDLDGSKLSPPIHPTLGVATPIAINWGKILAHVIAEGLVPPPVSGWAASSATSTDSEVACEVRNDVTGTGGPMVEMQVTNFRESAVIPVTAR